MSKKPKPAPPQQTDSSNTPDPIGVPKNYLAPTPYPVQVWDPGSGDVGFGTYPYTPPRYYDGDQYSPATMDKDSIAGLQRALEALGLKGYTPGYWDTKSQNIFEQLLGMANARGSTWQDLLNEMLAGGVDLGSGGGGGGGGGGVGAKPLSDDEIAAVAQKTAQGVLGRDLRPDELGNFIPAFRGVYAQQDTSTSVAADNIIRKQVAPQGEADAHQVGNVMSVIKQALGG